jgi:hypothetical protein
MQDSPDAISKVFLYTLASGRKNPEKEITAKSLDHTNLMSNDS